MKLTIRLFLLVALLLGVFGQYSPVSAAEVVRSNGLSAYTFFSGTDPSGCLYTELFVQGLHRVFKNPPGPGESTSTVYLQLFQVNTCTGTWLTSVNTEVPIEEGAFVIDKKLGTATLSTTITVFDYQTQSYIEVDLDLNWTATGPGTTAKDRIIENAPHCHWMSRYMNLYRPAVVSGTVTYDGTTITLGSSAFASISSFKNAEVTAGCE